ncbi:hypothetical protein [Mycolicibacterium baixiangningiae]|uniref:hypothetical protein n=1 Tax=Mycolicibacterium baixiangningiae TaxID=2761578 RepID=UPI0018D0CF0C|nr:hypothetical protein [Mycolicibacterium baixiangningiae]
MAAVETVFLVAAILWIVVVVAAVCVGVRVMLKLRARRRRVNHLLALTRVPLLLLAGRRR